MIVPHDSCVPLQLGELEQLASAWRDVQRLAAAFALATNVDTCARLLRGEKFDRDALDPAGLEWARRARLVELRKPVELLNPEEDTMSESTLAPGYLVALTLKPDAAPLRAYVGEVQTVDERGVRLTLVDWFIGSFSGWDLFVPWNQVMAALVATPDHNVEDFGRAAGDWQSRMDNREREEAPAA